MKFLQKQKGFTLVELIVVIVILGILAATALPKFINVTSDARIASVNGLAGGLRAAVSLVQARYYATGTNTSPVAMANGDTVAVGTSGSAAGIPTSAGILAALQDYTGFYADTTTSASVVKFYPGTYSSAAAAIAARPNCNVTYTIATGAVTTDITNCN